MRKGLFLFVIVVSSFSVHSYKETQARDYSQQAVQHSGGTDKCGCHFNRKTGEYHCHNRKQRGGDCPP